MKLGHAEKLVTLRYGAYKNCPMDLGRLGRSVGKQTSKKSIVEALFLDLEDLKQSKSDGKRRRRNRQRGCYSLQ